jgi:predicted permease
VNQRRRGLPPGLSDADAREVEAEIEAHLAMRAEALIREGLGEAEARAEAERRFGDREQTEAMMRARARQTRWRRGRRAWWSALGADLKATLRGVRRAPAFALTSMAIFAVGVGLVTSVIAVADPLLLRPLPYPDADRLVALWSVPESGGRFRRVSMGNWVDWQAETDALEHAAFYRNVRVSIAAEGGEALRAQAVEAGGAFFAALRPRFSAGRPFDEAEAQTEVPVAVVSAALGARLLGAHGLEDGATLEGASLTIDGRRYDVIGVLAESEVFPAGTEVWMPMAHRPETGALRNNINYEAFARLAPGVTIERADEALDAVADGIRSDDPAGLYSWGVAVLPLGGVVVGDVRGPLLLLAAAVGLLLLLASANLAGLGLARARRRAHEVAVHMALGSGRLPLIRRVIVEQVLLAGVGGGIGLLAGLLVTDGLIRSGTLELPRAVATGLDLRVAAFALVSAIVAGVLAGTVPAVIGTRNRPADALTRGRGGVEGGRGLPGAVMVGGEIALALALLVTGGLLLRSVQTLVSRELGFEPDGVVTAEIPLVGEAYDDEVARRTFWTDLRERSEELPGVTHVSVASPIPTMDGSRGFIDLPDRIGETIGAGYYVVGRGYFETLDVPLLAGRTFDATDGPDTERVAVINEVMADAFWPGQSPLGQQVRARSMEPYPTETDTRAWITVVGVAGDMRQYGFEWDPEPDMFVLAEQVPFYTREMTLVARTANVGATTTALRDIVAAIDPGIAVSTATLTARLEASNRTRTALLKGIGLFGGVALVLVCVGVYGLMAYAAEARTREMAIRRALGADGWGVIGLVIRSAGQVIVAGVLIGAVGGWALSGLVDSQLVGVTPLDPVSYVGAAALLLAVGVSAALVPAVRAARRDPLEGLRSEGG